MPVRKEKKRSSGHKVVYPYSFIILLPRGMNLHKYRVSAKVNKLKPSREREILHAAARTRPRRAAAALKSFTTGHKIADRPAPMGFMFSAINANPFVYLSSPFLFFRSLPSNELGSHIKFLRYGPFV